jgi:hypothetical protein
LSTARFEPVPAFYGLYFVAMAKTARGLGYALGLHGSMQRDLDVIAVPWTEDAADADALVKALADAHGLRVSEDSPKVKPHGRRAYVLAMGGTFYVDLSVMSTPESRRGGEPA